MSEIQGQCGNHRAESRLNQQKLQSHATVIMPAHNEADGIGRSAGALVAAIEAVSAESGFLKIGLVIACNGCDDATARAAREAAPLATVLDLPVRGKVGALNIAIASAPPGPIIVVDADIYVDEATLAALLAVLAEPGVLAASPAVRFALHGASAPVRAYYRIFARHPYLAAGVGGSGVYGLSVDGRKKLGTFPEISADDEYLRRFFPASTQRRVTRDLVGAPISVSVHPPATLRALVRAEIRSRNGDRTVEALCPGPPPAAGKTWVWTAFCRAPGDCLVFLAIKLATRMMMPFSRSGRMDGWATNRT